MTSRCTARGLTLGLAKYTLPGTRYKGSKAVFHAFDAQGAQMMECGKMTAGAAILIALLFQQCEAASRVADGAATGRHLLRATIPKGCRASAVLLDVIDDRLQELRSKSAQ